jgi:hypothetical protein
MVGKKQRGEKEGGDRGDKSDVRDICTAYRKTSGGNETVGMRYERRDKGE